MGVKGESSNHRAKAVATDEQMRLARLTLEGNSAEEDPANIQRLIKRVIETTRCTQARAELALYDNDNDLAAAIDYILEHESETDSWTEQKSKKDKKKEEEEKRPPRGQSSTRGRGGYGDRGGRGRGRGEAMGSRGASRGASLSGRGRGYAANSAGARPTPPKPQNDESITKTTDTDSVDEGSDWKGGPMVFHRSEDPATSSLPSSNVSVPVSQASNTPPAPISFAAVAAAAAKKDAKRQQPPPTNSVPAPEPPAPASNDFHHEEPVTSTAPAAADQATNKDVFYSEPSVAHPINQDEREVPGVPSTSDADDGEVLPTTPTLSPAIQANWTSQLKNDLGIGISSPPRQQQFTSVQSLTSAPAGVEFVTATVPPGLSDYHFGFVDGPQSTDIPTSAASVANTSNDVLFASARSTTNTTSGAVPPKVTEAERPPLNGDFSLKASPPISHSYGQQQQHNSRSLSYADPSSVSYAPTTQSDRGVSTGTKPPAPIPHPPQQSAHQAPQQIFPTQMPYGSYPYMNMNMYSPVTGVRAEDQYAALYAASMPFGMGVDLSAILPPTTPMSQAGASQQHPGSTQHRSDTHNLVDMNKFASGNTRDGSGQQPSNVAPPPGFANPSFMPQPGLSSLFLQQQFPPHPYSFMMPNVGSGRQMYPQEDDRKSYDKMGGAKQAQATPPQHYHNGGYLNSGLNKKPYNWNS
ncbi:hypothetical protein OESDEN_06685 [Oesophagostomum dentatum]|uniref:Uncharacterized protein n=1 Tax=Oesophagostomum dentatum TaxID=61180 RepID=A0A0B1T823_OESDE|nr:hypothetical protein OESDEN_06685 [Oesophagostomum dentatum]